MTSPFVIDHYELGDSLGIGGFGEVFRARRADLDREDAIKILHAAHCRDATAVARFVAEARAANQIEHPGIVNVYGFGELADGRSYCVMELLRGKTLRTILDKRGHLPLAEALPLLAKIAEAIDAAHAAGVAHRDLKPENLFVEPDGSIRVIDFGLAKLATSDDLTTTGRVMGSPRYMSPEQCRGSGSDMQSDLYSFGAVTYEVLVGTPPFEGDALALALHHLNDRPQPPSTRQHGLPESVDAVVLALLEKDPERRPRPLAMAIASMTTGELPRSRSRRRAWILAGALGTATAAAGLTFALRHDSSLPTEIIDVPLLRLVDSIAIESPGFVFLDRDRTSVVSMTGTPGVRYEIGSHATAAIPEYTTTLADGRQLHEPEDGARLFDPNTGSSELVSVAPAWPSPDGKQLAVFSDKRLEVYDVATRLRRTVSPADATTSLVAQWSPDGSQLVWLSDNRKLNITRVADGRTRELAVPVLSEKGGRMPAAFVDDDHIVYCATENGRGSVRLRSTNLIGDAGIVLQDLDPDVNDCDVSAVRGRVAVAQLFGARKVGLLDLTRPIPYEVALVAPEPNLSMIDVSPDGSKLVVQASTSQNSEVFDRATNTRAPRPNTCGRAAALPTLQLADGWGFFESIDDATATTLRILTGTCAVVGEWRVPLRGNVTAPRCRANVCTILTYSNRELHGWALEPGEVARSLGHVEVAGVDPDLALWAVDVSPDGEKVVALDFNVPLAIVFETRGAAPPTKINVPGLPQHVVWGDDPKRFIVSGMNFDGSIYAVLSVGIDGTREKLWTSEKTWFAAIGRSIDGRKVFGELMRNRTEVLIFDRKSAPL